MDTVWLKVRSRRHFPWSWTVILGLVIWSLATLFLPRQHPAWPLWLYWATATLSGLLVLSVAAGHVLAHSLVARRRGVSFHDAWSFAGNGVAPAVGSLGRPLDYLVVSLAGPAASVAAVPPLWLAAVALRPTSEPLATALSYAAAVSVLLAVLNLLPLFPLDGGWTLHALLWWLSGDRMQAAALAVTASRMIGYTTVLAGVLLAFSGAVLTGGWVVLGGLMVVAGATTEAGRLKVARRALDRTPPG